jgi:hypothetical protein
MTGLIDQWIDDVEEDFILDELTLLADRQFYRHAARSVAAWKRREMRETGFSMSINVDPEEMQVFKRALEKLYLEAKMAGCRPGARTDACRKRRQWAQWRAEAVGRGRTDRAMRIR